jgi:hypothetical protein
MKARMRRHGSLRACWWVTVRSIHRGRGRARVPWHCAVPAAHSTRRIARKTLHRHRHLRDLSFVVDRRTRTGTVTR